MKQTLVDDRIVRITLGFDEFDILSAIRKLPYRQYDAEQRAWEVAYVRENFEAAQDLGLTLDFPWPDDVATKVGVKGRNLTVRVPPTSENIQACRTFPDSRTWNKTEEVWVVKPTRRNVEHLREHFPDLPWSQDASDLITRTEAPFVQRKEELSDLIERSTADYEFKTEPYAHQLEAFSLGRDAEAFAYFMEQGTGKTKVTLDNAAFLYKRGDIDGLLVVCPKSVKSTWVEQVEEHLPDWVPRDVLFWQSGKTKKKHVEEMGDTGLSIMIVNVDVFSTGSGVDAVEAFLTRFKTMFVIDESSRIKNPSAKRTKQAIKLAKRSKYRRILTGTPVTQSPLDLFTQFKFLDENILGFGSYYAFRNRYAILEEGRAQGGRHTYKKVVQYINLTELQDTVGPYSYRVTKDECLDLPETVYRRLHVELTKQQRRVYNDLITNMEAEIEGVGQITVTMALTLMLRLQQVIGGFFPTTEEERQRGQTYNPIPGGNPKVEAIMDDLDGVTGKVLIWARFRAEIDLMAKSLRKEYGAEAVGEFHGGINEGDRTMLRQDFQDPDHPLRFLVLQVDTGGVGLTFTEADKAYYLSNGFSLESRLQSEARNHRAGSEMHAHITYTDVIAQDTLDPKVLKTLRGKLSLANVVTGDNWKEWV